MKTKTAILAILLVLAPACAMAQTVYKCVQDGKTSYQADPCPDAAKQGAIKPQGNASTSTNVRNPRDGTRNIPTLEVKEYPPLQPLHYCKGQDGISHGQREPCEPDQTEVSSIVTVSPSGKLIDVPLSSERPESNEAVAVPSDKPMPIWKTLVTFLVVALCIIGTIGILIDAFKTSIWWGLACFFIPGVMLLFLISHWSTAKNSFFLVLAGVAIALLVANLGQSGIIH
jgi:uncharacterized membrane protein YphA (DoxX/SURF4 family)